MYAHANANAPRARKHTESHDETSMFGSTGVHKPATPDGQAHVNLGGGLLADQISQINSWVKQASMSEGGRSGAPIISYHSSRARRDLRFRVMSKIIIYIHAEKRFVLCQNVFSSQTVQPFIFPGRTSFPSLSDSLAYVKVHTAYLGSWVLGPGSYRCDCTATTR